MGEGIQAKNGWSLNQNKPRMFSETNLHRGVQNVGLKKRHSNWTLRKRKDTKNNALWLEETIYFKPSFQPLLCSKFHQRRLILLLLHSFVFKVYKINQECKKRKENMYMIQNKCKIFVIENHRYSSNQMTKNQINIWQS